MRISEEGSIGNREYEAAYQVELEKVRGKLNQEWMHTHKPVFREDDPIFPDQGTQLDPKEASHWGASLENIRRQNERQRMSQTYIKDR